MSVKCKVTVRSCLQRRKSFKHIEIRCRSCVLYVIWTGVWKFLHTSINKQSKKELSIQHHRHDPDKHFLLRPVDVRHVKAEMVFRIIFSVLAFLWLFIWFRISVFIALYRALSYILSITHVYFFFFFYFIPL